MLEAASYRELAARTVGRTVERVDAPDDLILRRGLTAVEVVVAMERATIVGARRTGKVVFLDTDAGHVLALRFGMTGVLEVDGSFGVGDLRYSSNRHLPAWIRFALHFADGGVLALHDARRLGGIELDPDESVLGIDASEVDAGSLASVLGTSTTTVKARLMDQARLAGLGNLLADEILWRAGIDPSRRCVGLTVADTGRLAETILDTIEELAERGGSHLGDLPREPGAVCPLDGTALVRRVVGGRTTYSCPGHQV